MNELKYQINFMIYLFNIIIWVLEYFNYAYKVKK
jgi:hypothetical protein